MLAIILIGLKKEIAQISQNACLQQINFPFVHKYTRDCFAHHMSTYSYVSGWKVSLHTKVNIYIYY